jgi:hypothetical protein
VCARARACVCVCVYIYIYSGSNATHELLVPAIRAWSLLVSSLPDAYVFDRLRRLLAVLDSSETNFLEHTNIDVRVAATEAASVVYEAVWRYSPEDARKVLSDLCADEEEEEEGAWLHEVPALEDQMSAFDRFAGGMDQNIQALRAKGVSEAEIGPYFMCVCVCVCIRCKYIHTYVHTHIHTYIHIYIYIYIYII